MLTLYNKARVLPKVYLKARARLGIGDRGATAVEYGLIIALIAAVIAATVAVLGNNLNDLFGNVGDCVGGGDCPGGAGAGGGGGAGG
jgi:pilus assembly protein Flp/PilA